MSKKNVSKYRFIWLIAFIFTAISLAIVVIPPLVNLNFLKPKIENIILTQTGIPAKINGNINFSLLGHATIVANDINIPNGTVDYCKFTIPFFDIFNLKNANVSGDISVSGASVFVENIVPFNTNNTIKIHDSNVKFLNKDYHIINADFLKNTINAVVRTDQHKYEIKYNNHSFIVKNKNNDLYLSGELFDDGTAIAHIEITAQNINRWFEFDKPKITGQFPISADLFWDGEYGIKFTNISVNGITGSVDLQDDGYKIVKLKSNSANYDLSFFLQNPDVLKNASFDLDFYGDLKLADNNFKHVKIVTVGSDKEIKIDTVITDDLKIHGGTIDENGAHNLYMSVPEYGVETTCLFNGTPTNWYCDNFAYGDYVTGKLHVDTNYFVADLNATEPFRNIQTVVNMGKKLGTKGIVKFNCPDMRGEIKLDGDKYVANYDFLNDKTLDFAKIDLPFLPDFMKQEPGDFVRNKKYMVFTPHSNLWRLSKTDDYFVIRGDNFKTWFPNVELDSVRDLPYVISGIYKNGNISNLLFEIAGHKFYGSATPKSITLKTKVLNIDSFTDKNFKDNFEELSFFKSAPITIPFEFKADIAFGAESLIYNNKKYDLFIYSLHDDTQTFSISDSKRGNMLATIKKHNLKYAINVQLNKFVFDEMLLPENMPLNLSNTTVTAEIKLNTSGKIAHDVYNNLHGTFDASFDSGKLYGFGFDKFYASAKFLTLLNSEYFLTSALSEGITSIKKMHIIGTYESGNIKTLHPLTLSMPHVDATGNMEIQNGEMMADLQLLLRGIAPTPEAVDITIYPNNNRDFSLSQIMMNFDYEYMKSFIQSHDKF